MNQLDERQLKTHMQIVGWLLVAYSILNAIGGLVAFVLIMSGNVFFTQLGAAVNDPEAARIFAVFDTLIALAATATAVLVIGLAIPSFIAGLAVLARRSWARILGVVVSAFMLFAIPVGTLIGTYAIFVLMQDAAASYFGSPSVSPPGVRQLA